MRFFNVLALLISMNAHAEPAWKSQVDPVCLSMGHCIEHNGKILDIRSASTEAAHKLMGCDMNTGVCSNSDLKTSILTNVTPQEYLKITKESKDKNYFIPLSIKSSDALVLVGALSLGTIVFNNDREIMDFVQESKSEKTQNVADISNLFGRQAIVPIVAGAYFVGVIMKDNKLKQVGLFAVSSGLATQLITEVFKKSFLRARPSQSSSPYDFGEEGYSFFSGHSSAAFSLATVIAEVYKDKPIVPYLAYGVAALTAYSRMHDNKHWATDVLAGAVAGRLITKIMMRTWENKSTTGGLVVTPLMGSTYGLSVSYTPNRPKLSPMRCSQFGLEGRELIDNCIAEMFYDLN